MAGKGERVECRRSQGAAALLLLAAIGVALRMMLIYTDVKGAEIMGHWGGVIVYH